MVDDDSLDVRKQLYDYARRDFETASRHWISLDTKASQLIAANAVLLGLVVGGTRDFLLVLAQKSSWEVIVTLLFLIVVLCLIASFISALCAWRLRTIETIPAALAVIENFQDEGWTSQRGTEILALRVAKAAAAHMKEARKKSRHLKYSTAYLAVAAVLIAVLIFVSVGGHLINADEGGEALMGGDNQKPVDQHPPKQGTSNPDREPASDNLNPWDDPNLQSQYVEKSLDTGRLEKR